jgi:hypothetical protein
MGVCKADGDENKKVIDCQRRATKRESEKNGDEEREGFYEEG